MVTDTPQLDAAHDNSKAFSKFLKRSALGDACREMTLKRRLRHKILPQVRRDMVRTNRALGLLTCRQRIRMPIDAKASDLPHVPDDETWYRYVCCFAFVVDRFVDRATRRSHLPRCCLRRVMWSLLVRWFRSGS